MVVCCFRVLVQWFSVVFAWFAYGVRLCSYGFHMVFWCFRMVSAWFSVVFVLFSFGVMLLPCGVLLFFNVFSSLLNGYLLLSHGLRLFSHGSPTVFFCFRKVPEYVLLFSYVFVFFLMLGCFRAIVVAQSCLGNSEPLFWPIGVVLAPWW